jgi:hypothetical protein
MGPARHRSLDPYAPPGANAGASVVEAAVVELPPGIQRHRLDAAAYATLMRSLTLRGVVVTAIMYVFALGFFERLGLLDDPATAIPNLVAIPAIFICAHLFVRARRKAVFAAFELLTSARALRRVGPHVGAAEALRPEVTSIFETRMGLFLVCEEVKCDLLVSRALGGYDEIRARLAEWAPIEEGRGMSGWWRSARASFRQRQRTLRRGTALERDPSLAAELDLVRAVSNEMWKNYAGGRNWVRLARLAFAFGALVFVAAQVLTLLLSR